MQKYKRLAILALFTSVLLNCFGLIAMRVLASRIDVVGSLLLGYLFASLPLLSPKLAGRPVVPTINRDSILILVWAFSLSMVYFLFLGLPNSVSPSQVILGLTLAPLIATFLSGDLQFKEALTQHKLKIAPILFLLTLGISDANTRSNQSTWTFLLILFLFTMSQTSVRKLSKIESPFYAQSRMALAVSIGLAIWWLLRQQYAITPLTLGFGLFFGFLLTIVFRFTLYGIRNTSAIGSALILSLNVPFSFSGEAIFLGRELTRFQLTLICLYILSIIIVQIHMQQNKPVALDKDSKPLNPPRQTHAQ